MEGDAAYFTRRAQEEWNAARVADHPNARHAHQGMATQYDELAHAIRVHDEADGVVSPRLRVA